jgi:hypothetical protein
MKNTNLSMNETFGFTTEYLASIIYRENEDFWKDLPDHSEIIDAGLKNNPYEIAHNSEDGNNDNVVILINQYLKILCQIDPSTDNIKNIKVILKERPEDNLSVNEILCIYVLSVISSYISLYISDIDDVLFEKILHFNKRVISKNERMKKKGIEEYKFTLFSKHYKLNNFIARFFFDHREFTVSFKPNPSKE